jgi:hypothetical protein
MLLGAARMTLEDATDQKPGWFYHELITITFCALALEALGNAFGERFISRWKDYENSNPVAKLRIICCHFGIELDFNIEPWSTIPWLVKFRNQVAHAKPEFVKEEKVWSRTEYDNKRLTEPKSKIEKEVSLTKAKRAYKAVMDIKQMLCNKVPIGERAGLLNDGWSGSSSILNDN